MAKRKIKSNITKELFIEKFVKVLLTYEEVAEEYKYLDEQEKKDIESLLWISRYSDLYYTGQLKKDLKVEFDFENFDLDAEFSYTREWGNFQDTNYLRVFAGGDWECPVHFILYFDERDNLRAYIPTNGNTFCKKSKCAFGSCPCDCSEQDDFESPEPDYNLMLNDIENRLEITD